MRMISILLMMLPFVASCADAVDCSGCRRSSVIAAFGGSYGLVESLEKSRRNDAQLRWQRMTASERSEACRKRTLWEARLLTTRNWIVLPGLIAVLLFLFLKFLIVDVLWHVRRANEVAQGVRNFMEDVLYGPFAMSAGQEFFFRERRAVQRGREFVAAFVVLTIVVLLALFDDGARLYDFLIGGCPTCEMMRAVQGVAR